MNQTINQCINNKTLREVRDKTETIINKLIQKIGHDQYRTISQRVHHPLIETDQYYEVTYLVNNQLLRKFNHYDQYI